MCGILGWAGRGSAPFSRENFRRALDVIRHRGPDDHDVWFGDGVALGHRRLSIIDLSEAGRQPMVSLNGRARITYNGEIYNYLEVAEKLRLDGIEARGRSDTGVLLEAIEAWGNSALSMLNGMWAFGLWSEPRRQLLLCRDRFGVKPLYYRLGADGIAFASEPKALLALYPENRRICEKSLFDFLAINHLFVGQDSFYEGIKVLPPAHFAVYDQATNEIQIKRYWDYPDDSDDSIDARRATDEFADLFSSAVSLRLRSDVPVGITLSGGLDSSAVLLAARRQSNATPICFTSTYADSGSGELEWATMAANAAQAELVQAPATRMQWLTVLRDVVWHMDSPGYSPAVYPLWCLMQEARAHRVPVLLEGQGADEALAGYPQYAVLELLDYLSGSEQPRSAHGIVARLVRMRGTFSAQWSIAWMLREISPTLLRMHRSRVGFQSLMRPARRQTGSPAPVAAARHGRVRKRLHDDHAREILPGLLHYGDAISMAHSIETRNPFLDYRLVEWMFKLPTRYKLFDGQTKWVLREFLRGNGMKVIGDRTDKRGYPTPAGEWLASEQGRELEHRLTSTKSILHDWIDVRKLNRLFELHRQGALAAEHHLYKLISVQMWISRCIDQE